MKKTLLLLFVSFTLFAQIPTQHCGFDFTSYVVIDVHENGKNQTIEDLRIVLIDSLGNEAINTNNLLSWKNRDSILVFTKNYTINKENEKEKWFFPYAKDNYLLSVSNSFQAEKFSVKIEDINGIFASQTIPLYSYNLYILCAAENERQAKRFGPRGNQPIEVILEKK